MRYAGLLVLLISTLTLAQQAADVQSDAGQRTLGNFNVGRTATYPTSINATGVVTGSFFPTKNRGASHGFLRFGNGTFKTFTVPGATESQLGTVPVSINSAGSVTGVFVTGDPRIGNVEKHGFLRDPAGTITTFDVPGSKGSHIGTSPMSINSAGEIAGVYENTDVDFRLHGFLRAADGTITTFDGSCTFNTVPASINPVGTITGWCNDASGIHGFVRDPNGTFITFDVPGVVETRATSINPAGTIAGNYNEGVNLFSHGFVRAPDGTISTFDPPGAQNTFVAGINPEGIIVGYYEDAKLREHGFMRASDGTVKTFDGPNAIVTHFSGIKRSGVITGYCENDSGTEHGFLLIP
jgi:hypothetical protein